jgi:putative ABC transport system permease protein
MLLQDIRYAFRALLRNPSFSLTTVLIIAVGLGSTTAIFSVVDRLLFRSLPYPQSDRIVSIGITIPWLEGEFLFSNNYFNLQDHQKGTFSALTSWTGIADCDLSELNPQRLSCAQVESNFLPALGVAPLLGRNFAPNDDRTDAPPVALVSYGLWKSRFAGSPLILGEAVRINGLPTRLIGVLPAGFELPNLARADFLVPQGLASSHYQPSLQAGGRALRVFARLEPGVSPARALAMAAPYLIEPQFKIPGIHTVIRSLRDYQVGDVKLAAWLLFGATLGILLIVGANATNLLLARSVARQRELAVRSALGAGRNHLLRQHFTESLLLTSIAALFGVGFAFALLQIFKGIAPVAIPRIQQASLDGRVLLLLVISSLVFAVVFALATANDKPEPELLTTGGRIAGNATTRFRSLLITAQIAVSLVLLSISGLLLKSLSNLQGVAAGISAEGVTTAEIAVGPPRYPNAASRQQFFETLAEHLRRLPGVSAVALSDTAPPIGFEHTRPARTLRVTGRPVTGPAPSGIVAWRSVSPDYFKALGIPILQGRGFNRQDSTGKDNPIIISQAWSRQLFGKQDPTGQTITLMDHTLLTVAGVAADVKNNGLAQPADPEYYTIRKQVTNADEGVGVALATRALHWYDGEAFVIVRSSARPAAIASFIRNATAAVDPTVPVAISSMQERLATLSERPRFTTLLLSLFALVGVTLAVTGLYGLVSFLVIQRTQEIGIRMSVGATPFQVGVLMLRHALFWSLSGVLIGSAITVLIARWLRSLVFQVPVENPTLFGFAAGLMLAVALAAALVPSLRAATIDPIAALRRD